MHGNCTRAALFPRSRKGDRRVERLDTCPGATQKRGAVGDPSSKIFMAILSVGSTGLEPVRPESQTILSRSP